MLLAKYFDIWEELLADGLIRMHSSGALRPDADPGRIATFLVAALQGSYLLARMARSAQPMQQTLDLAIDHVRTFRAT